MRIDSRFESFVRILKINDENICIKNNIYENRGVIVYVAI